MSQATNTTKFLKYFGLTPAAFLHSGTESSVYQLNESEILRVYAADTEQFKVTDSINFYSQLTRPKNSALSLPTINSWGEVFNQLYSIEPLIEGTSLDVHLKKLDSHARQQVLKRYAIAAGKIKDIGFEAEYYGEIMGKRPHRKDRWTDFLITRIDKTLGNTHKYLKIEVPDIDKLINDWQQRVQTLGKSQRSLVHGDYFPSNIMVDNEGNITGVIDFSEMSLIGDWRVDLVGALIFLENIQSISHSETDLVLQTLLDNYPELSQDIIDIYSTYYSIYLSITKDFNQSTYLLSVERLKAQAAQL